MAGKSVFVQEEAKQEKTQLERVDRFLATQGAASGRMIFTLDATASRQPTWGLARELTSSMIHEAASVGSLSLQLVYFRGGADGRAQCVVSDWTTSAAKLAEWMGRVECKSGYTQIGKALERAASETLRARVSAVVLIGDMAEDDPDRILGEAATLGRHGTPVFAFLEGYDPQAESVFRDVARLSNGAFGRFDAGAKKQLRDLLNGAAAFAAGGIKALEARKDESSRLLLTQLKGGK
jgi:hypothetical protein